MKKLLSLLVILAMVIGLVACGAQAPAAEAPKAEAPAADAPAAEAPAEEPAKEEEIAIGGIVFKDDFFMISMLKGMEAACNDLGVTFYGGNSNRDTATEQALVYSYADMGCQGIVVAPYSEDTSVQVLRDVHDTYGMEVAVTNINLSEQDFICGGYTSDDYANGYSVGTYATDYIKEKWGDGSDEPLKIAILDYDATLPTQSQARWKSFLAALDDAGIKYEVIAQQSSNSSQDNVAITEAMLTGAPDVQIFYGCGTFSVPMITTIANMGYTPDDITIVMYDMNDQIADYLLDTETYAIRCTIEQDAYNMGYEAVQQVYKAIKGEVDASEYGQTVYMPGVIHSRDDLEEVKAWLVNYNELVGK